MTMTDNQPKGNRTMIQRNAIALTAATWTLGATLALGFAASDVQPTVRVATHENIPACQFEDGNPDGLPCVWTSPRTGQHYYNDGKNYR